MRRFAIDILVALWLLLLLVIAAAWGRSYLDQTMTVCCYRGQIFLLTVGGDAKTVAEVQDLVPPFSFLYNLGYNPQQPPGYGLAGFRIAYGNNGMLFLNRGNGIRYHLLAIPFWFVLLIGLVPPACWLGRTRRANKRRRANQCVQCGYDLRATPDRCPECGTAVVASAAPSAR